MVFLDLNINYVVGSTVLSLVAVIRIVDVVSFFFIFPYTDNGPSQADCDNWGMFVALLFVAVASVIQAIDNSGAKTDIILTLMMLALFTPLCSSLFDYSGLVTMMPGYRPEDTAWVPLVTAAVAHEEGMAVEMTDFQTHTNPIQSGRPDLSQVPTYR